jgi:hypothetical protein
MQPLWAQVAPGIAGLAVGGFAALLYPTVRDSVRRRLQPVREHRLSGISWVRALKRAVRL